MSERFPKNESPGWLKTFRLRGIAAGEWGTLAAAWLALLFVDLALRSRGYGRVRAWPLKALRPGSTPSVAPNREAVRRLQQLVVIASHHHLYPMLCLRRALVLQWLLARRGMPSTVRVGVARAEHGVDAHAWVEWEGEAIGEADDVAQRYRELKRSSGP